MTLSDVWGWGVVLRKVTSPKNEYNNLTFMHSKSTIQWQRELIFFSTEYCSVKLGQHMEHILVVICQHWRLLKFCISRVKLDFFWGGVKIFQNSDVTFPGGGGFGRKSDAW